MKIISKGFNPVGWSVVEAFISNLEEHPPIENFEFPVIRVIQHFQPQRFISGKENVLAFLQKTELINLELIDYHSPFVTQGKEFVQEEIEPVLKEIFEHPVLAWQKSYYLDLDEYRNVTQAIKKMRTFNSSFSVAFKAWLKGLWVSSQKNIQENGVLFWRQGSQIFFLIKI